MNICPLAAERNIQMGTLATLHALQQAQQRACQQATQTMKYKLVTLPRGTAKMPILDLGYSAIIIKSNRMS